MWESTAGVVRAGLWYTAHFSAGWSSRDPRTLKTAWNHSRWKCWDWRATPACLILRKLKVMDYIAKAQATEYGTLARIQRTWIHASFPSWVLGTWAYLWVLNFSFVKSRHTTGSSLSSLETLWIHSGPEALETASWYRSTAESHWFFYLWDGQKSNVRVRVFIVIKQVNVYELALELEEASKTLYHVLFAIFS